jgi:quinol-cytochrome oxidoreductase complex cytochrome b subunit/coenzyme F420-reducing hydrogenase delta subunit
MLDLLQGIGRIGFSGLRRLLATAFDAPYSPLRHLGSLTIFFFWIVLVSGIWLFAFFHTSLSGAYASVEYLTHDQWYMGGVMRSLHRYASDAAIITILLHMLKEFSFDRYRRVRWFSWFTGVPLLWMVFPLGITGYWLVWDELAHYVALTSAELLDAIPIFTDSMARNFLSDEVVSDRFFTLMAFLHLIGLPIFLVFGIWVHVFRISSPDINPPRTLMAGSLLAMLVLSVIFPAVSQEPADLTQVPESIGLDWYYLLVYPLTQAWSPEWVWGLLIGISSLIAIAPWLPPAKPRPAAVVDLANCNGCERCADDCPFEAISMGLRTDGGPYQREAVVDPEKCVSCGICVGSCPTATPFRSKSDLIPGIDLPHATAASLRTEIHALSERMSGDDRVIVVSCDGSASTKGLDDAATATLSVACVAQLPPPYIDYILSRGLADGVYLAGCAGGDCQYRLGARWTEGRLERTRDPRLRKRVDDDRIGMGWCAPWSEEERLADAVGSFRASIASEGPARTAEPETKHPLRPSRLLALSVTYGVFAVVVGWLSVKPRLPLLSSDQAMISLTFSQAGDRIGECRNLSAEELAALPPNMRAAQDCPRERLPVDVQFSVDGEVLYRETRPPSGIWSDGESTVYQRLPVDIGVHELTISMRVSDREDGFDYELTQEMELGSNQHVLVEFDAELQSFVIR